MVGSGTDWKSGGGISLMDNKGEVVIYQTEDGLSKLEVLSRQWLMGNMYAQCAIRSLRVKDCTR